MSGHERERLSAYLDGELPPGERAVVASHLAGCQECAAFLAALEAADRAAGELSAQPPEGYFDGFAARVVERIEARRGAARARRAPAWAWAAAAALVLAVVTPLTLRQSRTAPAEAPRPTTVGPTDVAPGPRAPEPKLGNVPASPAPPPSPARPAMVSPLSREGASPAGIPGHRDEAKAELDFAPEPAAAVAAGAGPAAMAEAKASQAPAAPPAGALPDARGRGLGERVRTQAADSMLERPERDVESAGLAAVVGAEDPEGAFLRLLARRPGSADGWRRLRDEWAAFAAAHPDSPRADEARVRAIEAGYEAWRAGGDPDDEAAFRRDARAYLERGDARQGERVRRLGTPP